MVERNLAKVEVASSSLVTRSIIQEPDPLWFQRSRQRGIDEQLVMARWQSGYAAACKAVYPGSIPSRASRLSKYLNPLRRVFCCPKENPARGRAVNTFAVPAQGGKAGRLCAGKVYQ